MTPLTTRKTIKLRPKGWSIPCLLLVLLVSLFSPALPGQLAHTVSAAGATYYLDCNGNDANNGTSEGTAWRTLNKANTARLQPGDRLLLKRGCVFAGTLKAAWNGTAQAMITISAYGSGNLPKIQNGSNELADQYHNGVDITGSYQLIEYLEVTTVNPPVDPGCKNNPIGFFVGFNFRNPDKVANGGSYNWLRFSKATRFTAGVQTTTETHHNRITSNTFSDNLVMQKLTPTSVGTTDDIGAWGILLRGNNHEVGYNYLSNNNSFCTYDTPAQGNAIELYEAQNNSIHHNTSVNDRVFSELGGSGSIKSNNNTFAYNLVYSNRWDAYFIIVRGGGNQFGPTYRTYLFNNTVYYTGQETQGIICHSGCSTDILTARNNIIWSELKAVYADAAFVESNNVYWNSAGKPLLQLANFRISSSSRIANPMFANPGAGNFHLNSGSPAINTGIVNKSWIKDLDGTAVPQSGNTDIGVYERAGTASKGGQFVAYLPMSVKSAP